MKASGKLGWIIPTAAARDRNLRMAPPAGIRRPPPKTAIWRPCTPGGLVVDKGLSGGWNNVVRVQIIVGLGGAPQERLGLYLGTI